MNTTQDSTRIHPTLTTPESAAASPRRRRSRSDWSPVVGVGGVRVAVLVAVNAVQHAASDPQVTSIQQLIQHANAEQSEAIAYNDPALMMDTSTAAYYRQLVSANQDLA